MVRSEQTGGGKKSSTIPLLTSLLFQICYCTCTLYVDCCHHFDGLEQEKRNSSALATELGLFALNHRFKVLVTNIMCCVSFVAYCGVNQCQCDHFIAYYLNNYHTISTGVTICMLIILNCGYDR